MAEAGSRRTWLRVLAEVVVACAAVALLPSWWCGRDAVPLFEGEVEAQLPLARSVASHAIEALDAGGERHQTGSARFDGEWAFVTCQMTVLGLVQLALSHPEVAEEVIPAVEMCLDWMVKPDAVAFGAKPWAQQGLVTDRSGAHAWVGYLNVALSMHRMLKPRSRFASLNDQLSQSLLERIDKEPFEALETYPGETYPADLATVGGSIGLRATALSQPLPPALRRWLASFRRVGVDPDSGLAIQSIDPSTGAARDEPRASGTAFAAYFLAFADPELSRSLYEALDRECRANVLGFGVTLEYPDGADGGFGDIDSGPVVFGVGPSATAFSIASARIHGDRERFVELYRTAHLFGAPWSRGHEREFLLGGPLGNALILAMVTATEHGDLSGRVLP